MLKLLKLGLGTVAPWAPVALKVAPWVGLTLFFGLFMYRGQELKVAAGQVKQAAAQCQQDATTAALQASNAAAAQLAAVQARDNTVITGLQGQLSAQDAVSTVSDNAVTTDAATPGNDAKSAPVLLDLSKTLMGDTP